MPGASKPSLMAPILLADADYYGTLAATRSLGARSIPVYVASDRLLAASRWSRFATRALAAPPIADALHFLDWLCDLGVREPGIVLYPTSDDVAYLYALREAELSRTFKMYQPGVDAILRVLDKKSLYAAAREAGLPTPETWFPESDADVARIAREAPFPLLIKSRTQVLSRTHTKGVIVKEPGALVGSYREFVASSRYGKPLLERFPDAVQAMIQTYLPTAANRIHMLASFLDRTGSLFASRAAVKILQRPRTLGVGLCFEGAALNPDVVAGARRLAHNTGYFGVFSIEFIENDGRYLLIDFNPRFYNQLAFDVARGFAVPEIVYAAATGSQDEMARLLNVEPRTNGQDLVFCNTFGMDLMLLAQRISGHISAADRERWRRWREEHRELTVDPTAVPDDILPALVDAAAQLYGYARHPRAFVRAIMLDRATY
jgi:predicted ATP-grasp superfamily ATP-dependent carboligase